MSESMQPITDPKHRYTKQEIVLTAFVGYVMVMDSVERDAAVNKIAVLCAATESLLGIS